MIGVKNNSLNYLIISGIMLSILVFYILPVSCFDTNLHESHCLHQQWFAKPCPGCGITRAVYYATHFELSKSITFNPSIVFLIPAIFLEILFRLTNASWIYPLRFAMYLLFCIVSPRPTTPLKFQEKDRVIYCRDSLRLPRGLC
jgi:hypothetical protein